jgi:general stress protein YciG
MSTYKPTEHDGLKQDGTEDKRVGTHEFAGGKVDPHEAGRKGGKASGGSNEDYEESGSGNTDNRGSAKGGKCFFS